MAIKAVSVPFFLLLPSQNGLSGFFGIFFLQLSLSSGDELVFSKWWPVDHIDIKSIHSFSSPTKIRTGSWTRRKNVGEKRNELIWWNGPDRSELRFELIDFVQVLRTSQITFTFKNSYASAALRGSLTNLFKKCHLKCACLGKLAIEPSKINCFLNYFAGSSHSLPFLGQFFTPLPLSPLCSVSPSPCPCAGVG